MIKLINDINWARLTYKQRGELISQYCELVIDGMDFKALEQYAHEQMTNYFDTVSDFDLKEEINDYDEKLWDELIANVTTQKEEN
tara:strand:+ start:476 stop:730 length:255 start_codon:yes stop_codon:yes gene_type:complete